MIEIISLVFFSRRLRPLISRKGESKGKWITLLVISWFVAEFLGVLIGLFIFGEDNIAASALTAYIFAFASAYMIRAILYNKPDSQTYEQLIDQIGTEQVNSDY
jgi:hypothetical protein